MLLLFCLTVITIIISSMIIIIAIIIITTYSYRYIFIVILIIVLISYVSEINYLSIYLSTSLNITDYGYAIFAVFPYIFNVNFQNCNFDEFIKNVIASHTLIKHPIFKLKGLL